MQKRRQWLRVAALGMSLFASCSSRMERVNLALERLDRYLHLDINSTRNGVSQSSPFELEYILSNTGLDPIDACLGVRNQYFMIGGWTSSTTSFGPSNVLKGSPVETVDHPYCKTRFQLDPGGRFSWRETKDVLPVGIGEALLSVSLEIVHPLDCDEYGCYNTEISAKTTVRVVE